MNTSPTPPRAPYPLAIIGAGALGLSFATRLAQYEAGQKQWDTETILLQVVRGVK